MSRTHVTFLIDRSGSMESQAAGVKQGFKDFVQEQRNVEGDCRLTVIQFDNPSGWGHTTDDPNEILAYDVDIREIDPVKAMEKFQPRGGTPLYDATARAIFTTEAIITQSELKGEKPDHIIFVVFTDGAENSSREYDFTTLTELVKAREAAGWTFVYLGANHDAYAQSATTGVAKGNTQAYAGSSAGAMAAYSSLTRSVTNQRTYGARGVTNAAFFVDKAAEEELAEPSATTTTKVKAEKPSKVKAEKPSK